MDSDHAGVILELPTDGEYQRGISRPILLIAGENAHSRYYSEDAYQAANEPKELVIVPDADHVELYDNMDKIPFDKIEQFFQENLK